LYVSVALVCAAVVCAATLLLQLPLVPSLLLVAGTWVAVVMSSQSVGVSGINPMEVFGVMVMLIIQLFFHDLALTSLLLAAAVVAVACGLTGDVMNDFKTGALLGTNPRHQWIGQAVGGIVGAVVAAVVLFSMLTAYGPDAFGVGREFVAAQAGVVAAMVGGVPNLAAFAVGAGVGLVLALLRLPVLTLGLGIYLPFYLSLTAFVGGMAKWVFDRVRKARGLNGDGLAVAAGLLGGESLVGVLSAFALMFAAL
jgi:uncharacterized oligopeptide transporter (OPT) family protein